MTKQEVIKQMEADIKEIEGAEDFGLIQSAVIRIIEEYINFVKQIK